MSEALVLQNNSMTLADPASVAAAESAKQRIQAAYIMAAQRPRDVEQARIRILDACKRPRFAAKVEYSKPVGGGKITGPSVRLAETALREWGNIMSDQQVVYEDDTVRRIKIYLTDLETNAQFRKEISVKKTVERQNKKGRTVLSERTNTYGKTVYVVVATDDEMLTKEAALISKAVRNEGLRLIPTDIIEEAMDTAKETLASRDKSDPDSAKRLLLDSFAAYRVMPKDIESYLGHKVDRISGKEMQDLRGIYRAMKDEGVAWDEVVADRPDAATPMQTAQDKAKELGVDASNCKTAKEVDDLIKSQSETVEPIATKPEPSAVPEPAEDPETGNTEADERATLCDVADAQSKYSSVTFKKYVKANCKNVLKWRDELTIEQLRELVEITKVK